MAEELLDRAQVRPGAQEMGGEGVAQGVRRGPGREDQAAAQALDCRLHVARGERAAADGAEQGVLGGERLLAEASPAERKGLLAGKIEDGLNTVVRQIAFHRFECRFHEARKAGELSPEQIGGLWLEVMGESLGPAVRLNRGYEYYWAYVSHFVHAPFYVYAYAFGDLLVRALMEKRREDPKGFTPLYEGLLAAGGSQTYVEALAPFGLDARQKSFWAAGCTGLERLVDEFEELV